MAGHAELAAKILLVLAHHKLEFVVVAYVTAETEHHSLAAEIDREAHTRVAVERLEAVTAGASGTYQKAVGHTEQQMSSLVFCD